MARKKGGKTRPQEEKHSLKPLRNIEIHPEAGSPSTKAGPCCYEYQVEMDKTRAFLRTTARYSAIPVRRLAVPGKGGNSPGLLWSVDDMVGYTQAFKKYSKQIDDRHRSPSFFRRNFWWLLAFSLLLLGDLFHVAEFGVLAAWLTPPYAVTGGLLLVLWAWSRWPTPDVRRNPGDLSAKIDALGESLPLEDNLPGLNFGHPATWAAKWLALDFVEGRVSQVSYTYFNIPSDEGDDSIVVLDFRLLGADESVLSCRHEVRKCDALFFVCEGEVVRLLGRVDAGKMTVDHAANLTDGHVYSDFFLISLAPGRLASKSPWFFLRVISETAAIAGGVVLGLAILGLLVFWAIGLLLGLDPVFREVLGQLARFSAASIFLALIFGAGWGALRAGRAWRIAHALGLQCSGELVSRQRFVCNQNISQW